MRRTTSFARSTGALVFSRLYEISCPTFAIAGFDALASMPGVSSWIAVQGAQFSPSPITATFDTGARVAPIECPAQAIPPIRIFEVPNVLIMGRSDALFVEKKLIGHGIFDMAHCLVCEERHRLLRVRGSRAALLAQRGREHRSLDAGLCLVGTGSGNWAHWLTEILPRAVLLGHQERFRGMPAIIDAGLPESMTATLRAALGSDREFVPVRVGELIRVARGVVVSPSAEVPYEYRSPSDMAYGDIWFSPPAIRAVQEMALDLSVPAAPMDISERLFVKRAGGIRALIGVENLEQGLAERGFRTIRPERSSFEAQVAIFRDARVIVSQAGAGLMNMMFVRPGCKIFAMTTHTHVSNYFYFSMVAEMLGHELHYVFGAKEASHSDDNPHQDFSVVPGQLFAMIDRLADVTGAGQQIPISRF